MSEENVQPEDSKLEEEETTLESEEVEAIDEELEKAKEVAENQKIRAEKAEKELKALKGKKPEEKKTPKNDTGLSDEDILALGDVKNKEDRKFLIAESNSKGKSIEEILEDPYAVAALKTMNEERTTANATNTGKGNRGGKSLSPESIVEAHNSGKEIDPEKLAEAELELKMKEMKNRQQ